ncbi:MAG TPA: PQQ-binding-like beta-propeller repeat protein [Ktedonobacterales bacterium]|nr:PQQ-binding-like beta-propeller repeat protein [Ktedonobacterales bacterium]
MCHRLRRHRPAACYGRPRSPALPTPHQVSAPTVVNGVVYVRSTESDHHIYALDAATGKLRWQFQTGRVFFAPAVANEVAHVGSNDGFLYALSA